LGFLWEIPTRILGARAKAGLLKHSEDPHRARDEKADLEKNLYLLNYRDYVRQPR